METKEIGGYPELDTYQGPMLHEGAIALNSARNCMALLIREKGIKRVRLPKFLCGSVGETCRREGARVLYYSVDLHFRPLLEATEDWVYLVNYYGQISNGEIEEYRKRYPRLIVDNVQAYFQEPVKGIDTIYSCRKFLGVTDGAFLYSGIEPGELEEDESFERVHYLLGRFERRAQEFYGEYRKAEEDLGTWEIKNMSKLTKNLLHGIDYEFVKNRRTENFAYLHERLKDRNGLSLTVPEGAYMYPLYLEKGAEIRKLLQERKIYVPILWPEVLDLCRTEEPEYDMAANILPLPVDQRYGREEMEYMAEVLLSI